jgi:acetyl/propionyl-CoA carboxylase alpha subunit
MNKALAGTALKGVPNNLQFLQQLVRDERFVAGDTTTRFLEAFSFTPRVMEVVVAGGAEAEAAPRTAQAPLGDGRPCRCSLAGGPAAPVVRKASERAPAAHRRRRPLYRRLAHLL